MLKISFRNPALVFGAQSQTEILRQVRGRNRAPERCKRLHPDNISAVGLLSSRIGICAQAAPGRLAGAAQPPLEQVFTVH